MAKNKATTVNWDDVPDSNLLPAAHTLCKIAEATIGHDKKNRLVYTARLGILKPKELAGRSHFERFYIGTEADPNAEDPETWKGFGVQRLKSFITATLGEKPKGKADPAKVFASLAGGKVGITFNTRVVQDKKADGTPNPRAGTIDQTTEPFAAGDKEYGLITGASPTSAPSKGRKKHEEEEEEELEEEEEELEEGDEDEEEGEGDEDEGDDEEGDDDEEDEEEEEEEAPRRAAPKKAAKKASK